MPSADQGEYGSVKNMEQIKKNSPEKIALPDRRANLTERSDFFDEHPERIEPDFAWLNNWHFHLPGGLSEQMANHFQSWDRPVSDDYTRESLEEKPPLMSDRYFTGTPRAFFDDIARAAEETNVSVEEIRSLNEEIAATNTRADKAVDRNERALAGAKIQALTQELYEITIPVYRKLREYGYRHYDLVH